MGGFRELNKTCCNLVNFGLRFIVHSYIVWEWVSFCLSISSFSLRMGQFSNSVAAHPRTNKVEVTPPPKDITQKK